MEAGLWNACACAEARASREAGAGARVGAWRANLGGAEGVDLRDERCRSKFFFLSVFWIPPRGLERLRVEGLVFFFAGELGPLWVSQLGSGALTCARSGRGATMVVHGE